MYKQKHERRPIIDPVLMVLRSRRMLVALSALIAGIIVIIVPEFNAVHTELLTLLVTLALGLIGGYSMEDAAMAARERASGNIPRQDVDQLVKEVLVALVDEAVRQRETPPSSQ